MNRQKTRFGPHTGHSLRVSSMKAKPLKTPGKTGFYILDIPILDIVQCPVW